MSTLAPNYVQQQQYPSFGSSSISNTPMLGNSVGNAAATTNLVPTFGAVQTAQQRPGFTWSCAPQNLNPPNFTLDQASINKLLLERMYQLEMVVWQNNQLLQQLFQYQTKPQLNSEFGRPSSLALQCLQMAMTDLNSKRSNVSRNSKITDTLCHENYLSTESNLVPTRKSGSTCLAIKQDADYQRCTPWNRVSTPAARNGFSVDTVATDRANNFLSLLHRGSGVSKIKNHYYYDYPGVNSEQDLKWKVLNERVVKESPGSLDSWKPSQAIFNDWESCAASVFSASNKPNRNREPTTVWKFASRTLSTGPPLKSYLDDKDYTFHQNGVLMSSNKTVVANLPGRFTFKHGSQKTLKRCVSSTHKDLKKEVEVMYKNVHSKVVSNPQSQESIPLSEKTSPIFFTKSHYCSTLPSSKSSATQTDMMRDDDCYFLKKFERLERDAGRNNQQFGTVTGADSASSMEDCDNILGRNASEIFQKSPPFLLYTSGVKLSGAGYYCVPDQAILERQTNETYGLFCMVRDFEVGHREHGKVVFHGYTDVFGLDLDEIVHFSPKLLRLYPNTDMPKFGEGLHRPCTITLFNVWPEAMEGPVSNETVVKDPEIIAGLGYEAILRSMCLKFNAKFLSYSPESGEWTFMAQQL